MRNFARMKVPVEYSTDVRLISSERFRGWCVHMLCLDGGGRFRYNDSVVEFSAPCVVILTNPENVYAIEPGEGLRCEIIIAESQFIYSQLPVNHYGVGGSISLHSDPVINLTPIEAATLHADMLRISERLVETANPFYRELIGSLVETMVYDLFTVHARRDETSDSGLYTTSLVERLMVLLQSNRPMTHRSVAYYAAELHVTQKYLSDTIRRLTGQSVTSFIDRQVLPMLRDRLANTQMSLQQIADEFRFSSVSYLSRYISKHLGMTATAYRSSLQPKK